MLRMDDGLVATQAIQVTDITSFAAAVDAGLASVYSGAHFNVGPNVPAAMASVSVSFHDASALFGN